MSYITDTDLSYIDSSIQTLKVNVNSSLNSVWIELNNDDVSLNQIWNLMTTNASSNIALSKKLDNTTDTFTGTLTVDGCMYLIGNFYQNGSTYVVHAENLNTNADYITLRENAVLQIPDGSVSGILIKNADGSNDVFLGSANDAIMRIGWVNDALVALAAREDEPINGGYGYWNDTSVMFKTSIDVSILGSLRVNNCVSIGTNLPYAQIDVSNGNKLVQKYNYYGQEFQYDASYSISTSTTQVPLRKVLLTTTNLPLGLYKITCHWVFSRSTISGNAIFDVSINGSYQGERSPLYLRVSNNDERIPTTRIFYKTLSGINNIALNYYGDAVGTSTSISDATIEIIRVS
jgi:hypothetical protein